jgi:signal transduction histidine kinase
VIASQLLLATGGVLVGIYYAHRRLLAALDSSIQARAMSLSTLVSYDSNNRAWRYERRLQPREIDHGHPDLFEIRDANGERIASSQYKPEWLAEQAFRSFGSWDFQWEGTTYRALTVRKDAPWGDTGGARPIGALNIVYASPTSEMREEVTTTGVYIAAAGILLLLLTTPMSLWGIRRGLMPLRDLAAEASTISARHIEFTPPPSAASAPELAPLVSAMDAMLFDLRTAFTQQREFLADAAHELKTPIAVVKSTLQLMLQRPRTSEEYLNGIADALDDLARLENLVQRMMRLALAEQWLDGTRSVRTSPVDLAATCEGAIARIDGLAAARQLTIEFQQECRAQVVADPEDLELVWVNLLENAVHYSPADGTVRLWIRKRSEREVVVSVEDEGPGIPEQDRERVFERFHRSDPSRTRNTGGFGLGLAIAKALVLAYRGNIRAEAGTAGGTIISVTLPLAAQASSS